MPSESSDGLSARYPNLTLALAFANADVRDDLRDLLHVCCELMSLGVGAADPGVAAVKMQWWQAEILSALAHRGQHPLSKIIARLGDRHGLPADDFLCLTEASPVYVPTAGYPDYAALYAHFQRSGGVPARMAARVAGVTDPAGTRCAELLGLSARMVEVIRSLGADARRGHIYLPQDRMSARHIDRAMLSGAKTPEATVRLLSELSDVARARHAEAIECLPPQTRDRLRPLVVAGGLYMALLDYVASQAFAVVEQRLTLHPARRLWRAWRIARGCRPGNID